MAFDKEYHMRKALEFQDEGSCYIHTEMKDGKQPHTILCGDVQGMLWGIVAEIDRISVMVGAPFEETLHAIMAMRRIGFEKVSDEMKGSERRKIEGHDVEKEALDRIRSEEAKKASVEVNNLKVDLANKAKECIKYQTAAAYIKATAEARENKLMKENEELSKQVRSLEARLREMEKQALFGEED